MRRILVCCLILLLTPAATVFAQLPISELTTLTPPGGKQGTTLDVVAGGANLEDGRRLIFSHPGIRATLKQTPAPEFRSAPVEQFNQFQVEIGKDVPAGRYEARVVGRYGVSTPRTFCVGRLDEVLSDHANKTFETARELSLNTTVNGRIDATSHNYFKIPLKAGQRILCDCSASRIDSRLNGVLVMYSPERKEVGRARRTVDRDPLLDFTAAVDGEHYLVLHDALFLGGAEYFYRLSVHDQPYVDFVLPLAGVPGSNVPYTVYGRNLPGGVDSGWKLGGVSLQKSVVNLATPLEPANHFGAEAFVRTGDAAVDAFAARPLEANTLRLGFAKTPRVVVETEANDQHSQAQVVQAPCEVHGNFYPRGDEDWVQFHAEKGQVYQIEVISQRLGLPTDPYVTIQRVVPGKEVNGKQSEATLADVAQVDDPGDRNGRIGNDFDTTTDDPTVRFTAPETADYRIRLRDQFGVNRDDPRMVYRLAIRQPSPDFRLFAIPQQVKVANANQVLGYAPTIRRGGSTLLRVDAVRRDGFNGQIDVSVEGLPEGVRCRGAVMREGTNSAWLVLEADENAPLAAAKIEVVGRADIDGTAVARIARPTSIIWGTGNKTQTRAEHRALQNLVLAVSPEAHQVEAVLGDGQRIVTSKGGKVSIPMTLKRRGFAGDIKFVANNLPNELKPGDVTIKGADSSGKLEWTLSNAKAKPGVYTFYLRGDIKIKHVRNPDAIARAEQAQKELTEAAAKLAETIKQKTTENNTAKQTAQQAAAALQQADQALKTASAPDQKAMAQKAFDDASQKATQAKAAAAAAEKALQEATAAKKRADAAKAAADKSLAAVKKANAAKDANIIVVSSPVTIEVQPTPLKVAATESVTVKQGETAELPVNVERQFGFAEAVEIEPSTKAKGLTIAKAKLEPNAAAGKLQITAAADAAVGEQAVTIKVKGAFNKVPVEATQTITVRVEPK